ncbi:LysM peptidoglycan-binding domain-containing protein [uncultured Arthrobacter sp.]|uniref:LysM peptidoglycan-binding domain-containing protein n=1 Tax=uncultured Arthrobacter sp. TaxID=114050 RepID=UPI003217E8B1
MRAAEAPKSHRRRVLPADAAMAAAILLLGLFLAGTGGRVVQRWRSSSARNESPGFEDQLGIVANTAGLIVTVWWAMSLAIAVAAALLERSGKVRAASAAGKFAPAFMRRLALAAVGLQLLTAPLAAASTLQSPPGATASGPAPASAPWTPTPVPALPGGPTGDPPAAPPGTSAVAHPQWRPLSPVIEPGPLAGRPLRLQQPAGQATDVTVRPGDSLWTLSAARLGPFASDVDIALDWPRLYQANRDVIGANPHLLRPGQILRIPPGP